MAKRMTETTKWNDPWFNALSNDMKLFWIYILDNCNHAGIWEPNWPLLNYHLRLKEKDIEFDLFANRVEIFESGKWFIKKFVDFQYGHLNEANKVHKSVLLALSKEGASKPLASPLEGAKDKDKEKDKDNFLSLSLGDRGVGKGEIPDDLKKSEKEILDWIEYKHQKGQRYKPRGLEALWRVFRSIPEHQRRDAVDFSMSNNYSGLFQRGGSNGVKRGHDEHIEAIGKPEGTDSKFAGIIKTIKME